MQYNVTVTRLAWRICGGNPLCTIGLKTAIIEKYDTLGNLPQCGLHPVQGLVDLSRISSTQRTFQGTWHRYGGQR